MSPFVLIIFAIPVLSAVWLIWALRRLRSLKVHPAIPPALAVVVMGILVCFIWIILARREYAPKVDPLAYSLVLLWGLVSLPLIALPSMFGWSVFRIFRREKENSGAPDPARRQLLGTAAITLPVIATFGTAAISVPQRNRFRIREMTIAIPDLPKDLHGLRIAHISDTHVGKFTSGKVLHDLADATNNLRSDLVLLTGDLIDQSLDDLPEALDMIRRIDPRHGLHLIEGNHDLFQGPEIFGETVRFAGFSLLRDETAIITAKGHPLELLGIRWNKRGTPIEKHVDEVFNNRTPEAFPILLAHHPHAFDRAANLRIPLTLAGHTHGGQLMITPEVGAGPMMFKYWSGHYRRNDSHLIVSNGSGNWFPLRTAAPAEIIDLKLIRS